MVAYECEMRSWTCAMRSSPLSRHKAHVQRDCYTHADCTPEPFDWGLNTGLQVTIYMVLQVVDVNRSCPLNWDLKYTWWRVQLWKWLRTTCKQNATLIQHCAHESYSYEVESHTGEMCSILLANTNVHKQWTMVVFMNIADLFINISVSE